MSQSVAADPMQRITRQLRAAPPPAAAPRRENALYRPFFRAGILVVLTAGAVWGAYLLLRIGWSGSRSASCRTCWSAR